MIWDLELAHVDVWKKRINCIIYRGLDATVEGNDE